MRVHLTGPLTYFSSCSIIRSILPIINVLLPKNVITLENSILSIFSFNQQCASEFLSFLLLLVVVAIESDFIKLTKICKNWKVDYKWGISKNLKIG